MRERMHSLRMPTLLVWGENDPLVPLVYGEAMQQEIAGSRLVVIPRAAHVAMWDAPQEFNRVAVQFFDEVETQPFASGKGMFSCHQQGRGAEGEGKADMRDLAKHTYSRL